MKNIDIFNLATSGILTITANDLDAAHAYKVMKFKKAVKKAFEAIQESEKDALREAGIEDGPAFDKERSELVKTNENPERLAELDAQFGRFLELRKNILNEEVELEGLKTIPYEQFHSLQNENKELHGKPLNAFEDLLEGVLWSEEIQ